MKSICRCHFSWQPITEKMCLEHDSNYSDSYITPSLFIKSWLSTRKKNPKKQNREKNTVPLNKNMEGGNVKLQQLNKINITLQINTITHEQIVN